MSNVIIERVIKFSEINVGDTILWVDTDGKFRGIDKVQEIDHTSGYYIYLSTRGICHQGNFKKYSNQFLLYKVEDEIVNYDEESLKDAFLQIEEVFQNTYEKEYGDAFEVNLKRAAKSSLSNRIKFIDFTRLLKNELHTVRFFDDEEFNFSKEEVDQAKSSISSHLAEINIL